jgi:hypothetical protein
MAICPEHSGIIKGFEAVVQQHTECSNDNKHIHEELWKEMGRLEKSKAGLVLVLTLITIFISITGGFLLAEYNMMVKITDTTENIKVKQAYHQGISDGKNKILQDMGNKIK